MVMGKLFIYSESYFSFFFFLFIFFSFSPLLRLGGGGKSLGGGIPSFRCWGSGSYITSSVGDPSRSPRAAPTSPTRTLLQWSSG